MNWKRILAITYFWVRHHLSKYQLFLRWWSSPWFANRFIFEYNRSFSHWPDCEECRVLYLHCCCWLNLWRLEGGEGKKEWGGGGERCRDYLYGTNRWDRLVVRWTSKLRNNLIRYIKWTYRYILWIPFSHKIISPPCFPIGPQGIILSDQSKDLTERYTQQEAAKLYLGVWIHRQLLKMSFLAWIPCKVHRQQVRSNYLSSRLIQRNRQHCLLLENLWVSPWLQRYHIF